MILTSCFANPDQDALASPQITQEVSERLQKEIKMERTFTIAINDVRRRVATERRRLVKLKESEEEKGGSAERATLSKGTLFDLDLCYSSRRLSRLMQTYLFLKLKVRKMPR